MAWASFPCQDLSLAGWQRGLSADRSGTFWAFWRLMRELREQHRRPPLIVIENVLGVLYGDSFLGLCEALAALNMQFGALVLDAKDFLPQSRPRVFVVALDAAYDASSFCSSGQSAPQSLVRAASSLPTSLRFLWRWWNIPQPATNRTKLSSVIENGAEIRWHTETETVRLLKMMSEANREKISAAQKLRGRQIGFLYRRIRENTQRAEVRFDGIAGCLRTPQGGSSRQTVVAIENGQIRTRLLTERETARLMGVPDSFQLPERYNDAYKAMGDGVAVPVVRWLSEVLLCPLLKHIAPQRMTSQENGTGHSALLLRAERRATEWSSSRMPVS